MDERDISAKCDQLVALIRSFESCAVAFSAGVDSTVVAKAAQVALGDKAVAVTGASPSLAEQELEQARELARQIGIRHLVIDTAEFSNPNYTRNDTDRCYYCKSELFDQLNGLREKLNVQVVLSGANADDASDYRPGERAAAERAVRKPLAECGLTKDDVRALAAHWDLPIWNKPAMPCLSSRVAYGEEVTPERLHMIEQAERYLREQGLADVRVRYHRGDLARVEVPLEHIARLAAPETRTALVERLTSLGFKFVTLDLEGLRSGSLNRVIPVEMLKSS